MHECEVVLQRCLLVLTLSGLLAACGDDDRQGSDDGGGMDDAAGPFLEWYETCGDPVCGVSPEPFDDPNIPNCTSERAGSSCTDEDAQCDGVAACGVTLLCTDRDPTMQPGGCPISRARYKQDIAYLSEHELHEYHEQILRIPLASYRYRRAPDAQAQLGFVIEDIEPSAAVSGDRVNLYGYLSMAVAAIQVQQEQIRMLERELAELRTQAPASSEDTIAPLCAQ